MRSPLFPGIWMNSVVIVGTASVLNWFHAIVAPPAAGLDGAQRRRLQTPAAEYRSWRPLSPRASAASAVPMRAGSAPRQPQAARGDDATLDLAGAAGDRGGQHAAVVARQPPLRHLAPARALAQQPARTKQIHGEVRIPQAQL